jgi:hypothetical protein
VLFSSRSETPTIPAPLFRQIGQITKPAAAARS